MILANHFYFHWLYKTSNSFSHAYNIISGLFIWLFLLVALPFGLYNNNLESKFHLALFLLPSGLAWTLTSYAIDLVVAPVRVKGSERELRLNFIFWIAKILIVIHIQYTIRQAFCNWQCIDWAEYGELYVAFCLMIGLTYIPFSLYARYKYFHRMVITRDDGDLFELKGEGKKTERIRLDSILYIRSEDNYVDFVYISDNRQLRKLLLRASLSSIAEQLQEHPRFARVHRKYIINIQHLVEIVGDKAVWLKGTEGAIEIPVSNKFRQTVQSLKT